MKQNTPDRRKGGQRWKGPMPQLLPGGREDPTEQLRLRRARNPLRNGTLGDTGIAFRVSGPDEFALTIVRIPLDDARVHGLDVVTLRLFRWDTRTKKLEPVWNSGVNVQLNFAWARIRRPGVYVVLGLPRDRLVRQSLQVFARDRRVHEPTDPEQARNLLRQSFQLLLDPPADAVHELRRAVTLVELQTSAGDGPRPGEARMAPGGHVDTFPLPGGVEMEAFRERLAGLDIPPDGLPEEALFFPPEPNDTEPPWEVADEQLPWNGIDWRQLRRLDIWRHLLDYDIGRIIGWLFSHNWWMYQHDREHTGAASGLSGIRSTTVGSLVKLTDTTVDGPVLTKPCIVDGKIYVGTGRVSGGSGGTMYKIDLATGAIEGSYATAGDGSATYSYNGIGGSPAVTGGRVYFTAVHGIVYCLDAATMTLVWQTDLTHADASKNQPVDDELADSWTGPVVANGKVYVGSGEGEYDAYGWVFCLDATTGHVQWLFCTCQLAPPTHNAPNQIPSSRAAAWAAGAGFTVVGDGPETGSSVWSCPAYDAGLDRIFVGTGNSEYAAGFSGGTDLPDELYGSGMIALDASTGAFHGFYQPAPDDSYRPADEDIDVPGSATLFTRGGERVLAFGSKNGSLFLLDPATMQVRGGGAQRRQLLPREGGSGLPGDRGNAIAGLAVGFENQWGMYATPAIHRGLGIIYVGLGGRGTITQLDKTPFIRALNMHTLADAWPTVVGPDNVSRYTTASPPLYTSSEVGLSSPAVVNDVVFISTNKTALYGLDAATGLCLWSASGLPSSQFCLGPAIYGNYVVVGAGTKVYRYRLPGPRLVVPRIPPLLRVPWPWPIPPVRPPRPQPDPPPIDLFFGGHVDRGG